LATQRDQAPTCVLACGWPLAYVGDDWWRTDYFDPLALLANMLAWAAIVASTGLVVERWVRRKQQGAPTHPGRFFAVLLLLAAAVWVLVDYSRQRYLPEWYVYPLWLSGFACAISAVAMLSFRGVALAYEKLRGETL
jgi:drug/metabolite transporter (DMT)-like permease